MGIDAIIGGGPLSEEMQQRLAAEQAERDLKREFEERGEALLQEAVNLYGLLQRPYSEIEDGRQDFQRMTDALQEAGAYFATASDNLDTRDTLTLLCEKYNIDEDAFFAVWQQYEDWDGKKPDNVAGFNNSGAILWDSASWTGIDEEGHREIARLPQKIRDFVEAAPILPIILPLLAYEYATEKLTEAVKAVKDFFRGPVQDVEPSANAEDSAEQTPETAPQAEEDAAPEPLTPGFSQYEPAASDFERVGNKLSAFTLDKGGPEYQPLTFAFREVADNGEVIGEVLGTTLWGQTEINMLIVDENERGKGIGKKLLSAAEEFAKTAHESRGVTLWTPSFQGEGFYETAGYTDKFRKPLDTAGHFKGARQDHITYYKSLELDVVEAAKNGDYEAIVDYAKAYPGRVAEQLDAAAAVDPDLGKNLSPYFTDQKLLTLDVEDIKLRLDIRDIPRQTSKSFAHQMRSFTPG